MDATIVLPISRPDYLQRIFAQLELMPCDHEHTDIIGYIDGDLRLFELAQNLITHSKFRSKTCKFRNRSLPDVGSVRSRRKRIAQIHNEVKELIKHTRFVYLLEDDTLPPLNSMHEFHKHYSNYPYSGFISAIEIGRWGFEMIGGWRVDDVYNTNTLISTPLEQGIKEVDAAGLYCCMVKTDVYLKHTFAPFEEVAGPDVNFGLWLRREGYKNYLNFDLKCIHLTKRGQLDFQNKNIIQVQLKRNDKGWSQNQL